MRTNLKQERQKKQLTQVQIARQLDISERYYQLIEAGSRNGDLELWIKISNLFEIKLISELENLYKYCS